jgi:4-diphosphocytidyl-2-C-methyl-D-erythritol kinase
MAPIMLRAPAKVNLTLEVVGRRLDGYHDICSVVQAISLADTLTLEPASTLTLRCSRPDLEGPHNLVWRAAELLRHEAGSGEGAAILLDKRIPVAAGLGGGSSDSAAALLGLNELWNLRLPPERLSLLGAALGSDIPFFLGGSPAALAEGRGERLTPLPSLPETWLALLKPPVGLSAGAVYAAFPRERWSDGARTTNWLTEAGQGRLPPPFNDLEEVALQVAPEAEQARRALLAAGAPASIMSGSGSAYFATFERQGDAATVCERLRSRGHEAYVASFITGPGRPVRYTL